MAKKKIPNLRKEVQETIKDLSALEKDLARVKKNLKKFLSRPQPRGEDEWLKHVGK